MGKFMMAAALAAAGLMATTEAQAQVAVRVGPVGVRVGDHGHHRRNCLVVRFPGSLELADTFLDRLEKRAIARNQRRVADRAVAGNDR